MGEYFLSRLFLNASLNTLIWLQVDKKTSINYANGNYDCHQIKPVNVAYRTAQ